MAGKSLIGSLRVFLGLDTAEFTEGAAKAKDSVTDFVEKTKHALEALAAAFAVKKFVDGFIAINENLDALGKAAQKIGIPVEQLAELQYAAELADVPIDALQTSITKFSKGLSEFAASGKGDVGAALKAIGVAAVDATGKLRPQGDLLQDIAQKFSEHADGASKAALAMALFGKAGADLIPWLNEGRNGIRDAAEELLSFGGVPTQEATKAANELLDNFTKIKEAFYAVAQQVVILVTPAVKKLTDSIVEFLGKGGNAKTVATEIAEGLKFVAGAAVEAFGAFEKFAAFTIYLSRRMAAGLGSDPTKDYDAFAASLERINAQTKSATDAIKNFQIAAGGSGREGGPRNSPQKPEFKPFGTGTSEADEARNRLLGEAKRIIEQSRTPLQEYNDQVAKLNQLRAVGLLTQQQYNQALDGAFTEYVNGAGALNKFTAIAEDSKNSMIEYAETLKSGFSDMFNEIIGGSFNAQQSLQRLATSFANQGLNKILDALFATSTGANPLYGGGGTSSIFGKLFGFATGGSIMPGGSGGIDSQLVAFRKSPDERVDITRPGQRITSGGGSNVTFNINAPGADRAAIADLTRTVVNMQKNLYKNTVNAVQRERGASPGFAS